MKTFNSSIIEIFETSGVYYDIQMVIYEFIHFQIDAIDATNTLLMKYFIQYCYKAIKIDHIIYDDLDYYQRTTIHHAGTVRRPNYDPDIICDLDMDICDDNINDIIPIPVPQSTYYAIVYNHDEYDPTNSDDLIPVSAQIDYVLTYCFYNYDPTDYDEDYTEFDEEDYHDFSDYIKDYNEYHRTYIELINNIECIEMPNIILKNVDFILLTNKDGYNEDHRGSDHCKVKLDFHKTYKVKCPINLEDFFKALYRMKSHKWDSWYELYIDSIITLNHNTLCIDLHFDHGS